MPNFTKRAIRDAFLRQLAQRPLNQITVKDIVEECGINRNSFYYHYEGIPALLEEIIAGELDRLTKAYPTIDSMEQGETQRWSLFVPTSGRCCTSTIPSAGMSLNVILWIPAGMS